MSIVTTNGEFLDAVNSVGFRKLAEAKLAPSEKLRVYRAIKVLRDLAEDVSKVRLELVTECARKDEETGEPVVTRNSEDGSVSFSLEDPQPLLEWLQEELKVSLEAPFSAEALLEDPELTPADLVGLGPLVTD
jgi:hypothetical protein